MSNIPPQSMNFNPLASSIVGAQQKSVRTTQERVTTEQNAQEDRFEISKQLQTEGIAEAENETDRDADGRESWQRKASSPQTDEQPEEEGVPEIQQQEPCGDDQQDPPHLDLLA